MTKNNSHDYWATLGSNFWKFTQFTALELYSGIKNEKIDVIRYLYPGTLVALFFVLRADVWISNLIDTEGFRMSLGMRESIVYTSLFAGWLIWAGERAFHRVKVLARLQSAFVYCGLEANKRLPALIDDTPIDDHVRKLKLFTQGIPLQKFKDNRENLEGHLNISIVRMHEEVGDKSRISIIYAMKELDSVAQLDQIEGFQDGEIPIGVSHEGPVTIQMRDVAHVLVSGQTGGGKSNFEKVAASVLTINNKAARIIFLDFKGGMEIADLVTRLDENYENFQKYEGPKACTKFLSEFGGKIEARLNELARVGASNFDDYLVKRLNATQLPKPTDIEASNKDESPRRTYLIIDEIAQLYARDPSISKEDMQAARAAVNRIARQGRAAGVHLIVATQKPDATSFDQTVKANLPGVLCFPTVSIAASISALGSKRAVDLNPDIKGRAVWKYGPKVMEVQTYLFK